MLAQLVTPTVTLGGPRSQGTAQPAGVEVLRAWVDRAHIRLHPLEAYARGPIVVVAERAEWFEPDSGQIVNTQQVATFFALTDGLISRIVRYESLNAALAEAGLTEDDHAW